MRKIFISSTFRDMQAERDAIHTTVVPELRTMAQKYGEDVEVCDLRWGVNTGDLDSEAGSRKVLSVCLDEIDKCKPFMLIILGERYGWIPEPELLESAANRKNYQLEEMEKSVTALEIEYGALDDPEVLGRSIFMFREPMPEADEDYQSEGEDYAKRLNALKNRIRKLAGERVFSYWLGWDNEKKVPTELGNFTQIVTEQMRLLLEHEWEEYAKLHENQKEEKRHWVFVDKKAGQFGGRTELLEECKQKLEKGSGMLAIVGEAGSGKSTLCCKMAADYREQGWNVFPFICGNTGQSSSAMDILKQWVFYVESLLEQEHFEDTESATGINSEELEKTSMEAEWEGRFLNLLSSYSDREDMPSLLLVADGMDQLIHDEMTDQFGFLPVYKTEKAYFLLSCLTDYSLGNFEGDVLPVQKMIQQEKEEVLRGILFYQRKGLDHVVTEETLKKQGADNPLYLSLLMQRLAMMDQDDFAVIAEYGNDMNAINRYQIELVKSAPEDLGEMSYVLIQETGKRVNDVLVQRAAKYIAVSRRGLRERDLMNLLQEDGIEWSSLDFSRAVYYMPILFVERNNGQIDFTHRIIREGIRRHSDEQMLNQSIFKYLKTLPIGDELRMSEMIHYCCILDEKQYFTEYIEVCVRENANAEQRAARELYWICMEDGGEWLCKWIDFAWQHECGNALLMFFNWSFFDTFQSVSIEELAVQHQIFDELEKIRYRVSYEKSWEIQRNSAILQNRIGQIYEKEGLLEKAESQYRSDYIISDALCRILETTWSQRDFFVSCIKMGDIYMKTGDFEKAECEYKRGYNLSKKICENNTIEDQWDYIFCCRKLGEVYQKKRCMKEALEKYKESYQLCKKLLEYEKSYKTLREYGISCRKVGRIYGLEGFFDEAFVHYKEGYRCCRIIYEKQNSLINQREYTFCCCDLGTIYENQGDLVAAQKYFEESCKLMKKMYELQKTLESSRNYRFNCYKLANIYEKQGFERESLSNYFKVLKLRWYEQERTILGNNWIPWRWNIIFNTYDDLYEVFEKTDREISFFDYLFKENEDKKKLMLKQDNEDIIHLYYVTCYQLGFLYELKNKTELAANVYFDGLCVCKTKMETYGELDDKKALVLFYENIVDLYEGTSEKLITYYEEMLNVWVKILSMDADMNDWERYLSRSVELGKLYDKTRRYEDVMSIGLQTISWCWTILQFQKNDVVSECMFQIVYCMIDNPLIGILRRKTLCLTVLNFAERLHHNTKKVKYLSIINDLKLLSTKYDDRLEDGKQDYESDFDCWREDFYQKVLAAGKSCEKRGDIKSAVQVYKLAVLKGEEKIKKEGEEENYKILIAIYERIIELYHLYEDDKLIDEIKARKSEVEKELLHTQKIHEKMNIIQFVDDAKSDWYSKIIKRMEQEKFSWIEEQLVWKEIKGHENALEPKPDEYGWYTLTYGPQMGDIVLLNDLVDKKFANTCEDERAKVGKWSKVQWKDFIKAEVEEKKLKSEQEHTLYRDLEIHFYWIEKFEKYMDYAIAQRESKASQINWNVQNLVDLEIPAEIYWRYQNDENSCLYFITLIENCVFFYGKTMMNLVDNRKEYHDRLILLLSECKQLHYKSIDRKVLLMSRLLSLLCKECVGDAELLHYRDEFICELID